MSVVLIITTLIVSFCLYCHYNYNENNDYNENLLQAI